MSLTDSQRKKTYSNIKNYTAKINKKTTVQEIFGGGGKIYKGPAKDYPGIFEIIKKDDRIKVIPIDININKKENDK